MKITVHLIPIPPPSSPNHTPTPETVFHYTTGLKLRSIINSGGIKPTTAKAQGGLVRITVPGTCAPYIFPQLPLIAGTKPSVCIGLLFAGLELGSDPDTWRFTPEPVFTSLFREVEFYDFANNTWLAVDLAELACRN